MYYDLEYKSDTNIEIKNKNNTIWSPRITDSKRWWISHEFRNLSDHENWYGISMPWAVITTHARMYVSMAPEFFRVDYKSDGTWESSNSWVNFDDSNSPIKIKPHQNVSTITPSEVK